MLVLNLISVTSTATPISQEPQQHTVSTPKQIKVILPRKNPEISPSGPASVDKGIPWGTLELRKYWGGGDDDPLNSHGFIWNKEYMGYMKRFIKKNPNEASSFQSSPAKDSSPGFLSLHRMTSLDNLEIDLSKELMTPSRDKLKKNTEPDQNVATISNVSRQWKSAPTKREQEKWGRASKAGNDTMIRELSRIRSDREALAAESREQYYKLKKKLQNLTLGIGAIGLITSYISYSPQIAASYGAGLVGSLTYIRMLESTVDNFANGAQGVVKGAVAQPRLLVPVVLVMIYNRWNGIVVPEYGLMHLELIPMLVGFFTYKFATFAQALEEAFKVFTPND